MKPIAHIRTDLPQKFGIPRNSFLAPHLRGCIVFEPECALESAVAGIEGFSHLWLIWQFENGVPGGTAEDIAADSAAPCRNRANARWSPTVRPPRLGGTERVGVFASRSPLSPEPAGLKLREARSGGAHRRRAVLHVLGADLRDGTPILDIKPYIPFADCHPDARGGWIEDAPWHELTVDLPDQLRESIEEGKLTGLIEVLRQDPRARGKQARPLARVPSRPIPRSTSPSP